MSTGIAKFPIRNNRLRRNPAGNTLSQNAWNCHLHFVHGEIAPVPSILHSPSSLSSLSPLPGPYSSPRNDRSPAVLCPPFQLRHFSLILSTIRALHIKAASLHEGTTVVRNTANCETNAIRGHGEERRRAEWM